MCFFGVGVNVSIYVASCGCECKCLCCFVWVFRVDIMFIGFKKKNLYNSNMNFKLK